MKLAYGPVHHGYIKKSHLRVWMLKFWSKLQTGAFKMDTINCSGSLWLIANVKLHFVLYTQAF